MISKVFFFASAMLVFILPFLTEDEKQLLRSLEENTVELKTVVPGKQNIMKI
ncbi:MAG: hypothetical protein KTR26_13275 [Flammeovirgaceae bacterium]|nr:hypothetical protein [Flammeovirgaceae bacterium]